MGWWWWWGGVSFFRLLLNSELMHSFILQPEGFFWRLKHIQPFDSRRFNATAHFWNCNLKKMVFQRSTTALKVLHYSWQKSSLSHPEIEQWRGRSRVVFEAATPRALLRAPLTKSNLFHDTRKLKGGVGGGRGGGEGGGQEDYTRASQASTSDSRAEFATAAKKKEAPIVTKHPGLILVAMFEQDVKKKEVASSGCDQCRRSLPRLLPN